MSGAWYNEHDPFAAAWLRELIKGGHIADGVVDERSIVDVRPDEIAGFTQCHFFAGIGVWSYSARRAGWPDSRPIWSMSCPCQPFSAAGAGAGFDDERHLWPHAYWLIAQCRPPVIAGEQVASKDADAWIDLVQSDMEALGYPFGAVAFPSASVGAPHIRDRTYWMAHDAEQGRQPRRRVGIEGDGRGAAWVEPRRLCDAGGLDHHHHQGLEGQWSGYQAEIGQRQGSVRPVAEASEFGGLADANNARRQLLPNAEPAGVRGETSYAGEQMQQPSTDGASICSERPGPTNGHWRDADWLFCRDGKWRPVEPKSFPLAHGASARVGRLRGYGNAINAVQAQVFIEEVQDIIYPAVEMEPT